MNADEAREMANDLRQFADFVEKYGADLGVDFYIPTVSSSIYDETEYDYEKGEYKTITDAKTRLKDATKVLVRGAGSVRKNWDGAYLEVTANFGESVTFELNVAREKLCKRVVVGTEEVPERVIPASTREITEWVCEDPAILNL